MRTSERVMNQVERSMGLGIGSVMMAGLSAYQGAEVPEYRTTAMIFVPAWLGLAAVNFRRVARIMQQQERLPFDYVPVLGVEDLEKQIGLAA
jgi:hypothetical protein